MSSTLPSRADGYRIAPDADATRAFFEAVFGDLHDRILPLEASQADYDAVVDAITTQALAIVSANITVEVDRQRATLEAIEAAVNDIVLDSGAPAALVSVAPITGLTAGNVQSALAAIVASLEVKASLSQATALAALLNALSGRVAAVEDVGYVVALNEHFGS